MAFKTYTVTIDRTVRMVYSGDFRDPESPILIDGQPTPFKSSSFDRLSDGLHADGPTTAIELNDWCREQGQERWSKEDDDATFEEDSFNGIEVSR